MFPLTKVSKKSPEETANAIGGYLKENVCAPELVQKGICIKIPGPIHTERSLVQMNLKPLIIQKSLKLYTAKVVISKRYPKRPASVSKNH